MPPVDRPEPEPFEAQVAGVASLHDAVRRALYQYVVAASQPVGRNEAAAQVGVSRTLAAYHLDRLVDEGLLDVQFERLGPRRGPGAGRPAKLYRRSRRQIAVQLPPRNYELAARLLAQAVDAAALSSPSVLASAHAFGAQLGVDAVARSEPITADDRRAALLGAVRDCGYEPAAEGDSIRLRNCPFDALAREHRELVCGMNRALLEGLVAGVGDELDASLEPRAGECCVALRGRPDAS